MATPVTECAYITLKPGVDLERNTPEAQAWRETLATASAQEGYQRCYHGRQMENPNILMFLIDWDSQDAHQKFMSSPEYGPFKSKLSSIMENVHLHHVTPKQFPPSILGAAPCTEMATFYECQPPFFENVERFAQKLVDGNPKGYHGLAYGQVVETIKKDGSGREGNAVVLWIGWDSKEMHMKFRETDLFKENIQLLRVENNGAEMFHVPFKAQ